jgi:uncharacterized protein (TIGR00299 family) protein
MNKGEKGAKKRSKVAKSTAGRRLHIDAFSGMAGNMFMGALLDVGLSRKLLLADLEGLGVDFSLRVKKVKRGALSARYVDVGVSGRSAAKTSAKAKNAKKSTSARKPAKKSTHSRNHSHAPLHSDASLHSHAASHAHGRGYAEIDRLLRRAELRAAVKESARAIFHALAEAEAKVHGTKIEAVHFHEVGAVDAIVDVTAAAIGVDRLGVGRVSCGPVALGHGRVNTDHGLLPLPAPATLELLKGVPTEPAHVEWETVTPTGAAILRVLVDEYGALPAMRPEAVGYGAGNDRPGSMPNVVRLTLGALEGGLLADRIVCLETNLDDLVPEHFDHVMERLFAAGALDVSIQHVQMKKNRPGFLLRVLARPADRSALASLIFAESTAIGVRSQEWDRLLLRREQRRVETPFGRIRVKCVTGVEGSVQFSPEYDDCKKAATRSGAPLRDVVRAAEASAREDWRK